MFPKMFVKIQSFRNQISKVKMTLNLLRNILFCKAQSDIAGGIFLTVYFCLLKFYFSRNYHDTFFLYAANDILYQVTWVRSNFEGVFFINLVAMVSIA